MSRTPEHPQIFTHQHYKRLADALRKRNETCAAFDVPWFAAVARDLADVFEMDNPRFQRARFLTACGLIREGQPKREIHG